MATGRSTLATCIHTSCHWAESNRPSASLRIKNQRQFSPSSEASAASQSCSLRLMVLSGIGRASQIVDVRPVRFEPGGVRLGTTRVAGAADPGYRCIRQAWWRERGSRGQCTAPNTRTQAIESRRLSPGILRSIERAGFFAFHRRSAHELFLGMSAGSGEPCDCAGSYPGS